MFWYRMYICQNCNHKSVNDTSCEQCGSKAMTKAGPADYTWSVDQQFPVSRIISITVLLFILLGATLLFNHVRRHSLQGPLQTDPAAQVRYDKEYRIWEEGKKALELANKVDTFEVYQKYIDQNPDSSWTRNFVYYRDRAAYRLARQENSIEALEQFINRYPKSSWLEVAKDKLDKLKRKNQE